LHMDSIGRCTNTLFLSYMDVGSSLHLFTASTMTSLHHFVKIPREHKCKRPNVVGKMKTTVVNSVLTSYELILTIYLGTLDHGVLDCVATILCVSYAVGRIITP
jgi:hypothetical protein